MFDFIPYIAIPSIIVMFSKSYQEDIILSLLVLISILSIRIIYIYNINKKMGTQLIKLRKTYYEEHSFRNTTIVTILVVVFIMALSYFLSNNYWNGIPWLILIIFQFLYERYTKKYLQKGLMENGICTGSSLIEWDRIKSYKWVIPKKKIDYGTLKIGYSKFYSYHIGYLFVLDEQKGEVNELFNKMIRV